MESFKNIIFDSHNEYFRSPQGAVPCGQLLTLRVLVSRTLDAYGVTLRVWENDEEKFFNLERGAFFTHTPYCDYADEYFINVSRETIGLSWYQFIVNTPYRPFYVCTPEDGLGGEADVLTEQHTERSFQITVTDSAFSVPDWARGAVMYQIFPDRFHRAENSGDATGKRMHENWLDEPEWREDPEKGYYTADDFFGGNFKGIAEKLDYLKSLNVDVIYLNPVFAAHSNHRYDTADYENTDPLLGTNEDLSYLCAEAKKRGIRVILDGVFSHTGSDSRYFNKNGTFDEVGAYNSENSKYFPWYKFKNFPDEYESWWGVWSLPCVNETEPTYTDYILKSENSIVKRWIDAGISGWRLDVADELPDEFIKELRRQVKKKSPDALILGEVWEDASNKISYGTRREFLYGAELDTVMNYPLRTAIVDYLTEKISGKEFSKRVLSLRENYPRDSFLSLMNFLSTHDLERITTRFAGLPDGISRGEQAAFSVTPDTEIVATALHKLAALIIFVLPGMPCIYYGDEAGLTGARDPFNRKPFPWGHENGELTEWYRKLSCIHASEVFKYGKLYFDCAGSLLSIRRTYNGTSVYALVNPSDEPVETLLDETYFSGQPRLMLDSGCGMQFSLRENGYYLLLPPRSGAIFECFT